MPDEERDRELYTFVNRNAGRKSAPEETWREPDGEVPPAVVSHAQRRKKGLRGVAFVLTVQTVLALLLVLGALAVRLIGGDTQKQVTERFYTVMESGALDFKSLFQPIQKEEDGASSAGEASSLPAGEETESGGQASPGGT